MPDHISVSEATKLLLESGTISAHAAHQLNQSDRSVSVAHMKRSVEEPELGCFVIDASPSMTPYTNEVIHGQQLMINVLRDSAKCVAGALYVGQWLFSTDTTVLNPLKPLSQVVGGDAVALLNNQSYRPQDGNGTALYVTVFHVLQEMAANIAFALRENIRTSFTIGLITDGEDNRGGAQPSDIKAIVRELRANDYLTKSVVVGIENPDLSRQKIIDIQQSLGFDESIFVGQTAQEIRRAFALVSMSTLGRK